MFEFSQLRCFVAVAEELHFGRAATRLNMTQAPLSRHIQVLERILDVKLLDRTSRFVRLTPAGRAFLPEARQVIRAAELATDVARRVASGKAGALKIGFTPACAFSFLPNLVTAGLAAMPDIDLSFSEMTTRQQLDGLLSNNVDLGFMRPPITGAEFGTLRVAVEPFLVVVADNHPLAAAEFVTPKDLEGESFLMYSVQESRYLHDILVSLFSAANVLPRYVQHLSRIQPMLALVKAGLGCTIVPASAATLRYEGVTMLPLRLRKPSHAELFAVWRRDDANPILERMLGLLRTMAAAGAESLEPAHAH